MYSVSLNIACLERLEYQEPAALRVSCYNRLRDRRAQQAECDVAPEKCEDVLVLVDRI